MGNTEILLSGKLGMIGREARDEVAGRAGPARSRNRSLPGARWPPL